MSKLNFKKLSLKLFKNLPPQETRITLSTLCTLLRILLTPFIVIAMVKHMWGVAFWLFVIAAISDVLDGNIARWFNERTFLGACLDPIADKLLLVSCFFTLAFVQSPLFGIPIWFVFLVLFRELTIISGACAIYMVKGHLEVHPTLLGKATTFCQIMFIIWLFACYFFHWLPIKTYYVMFSVVTLMVCLSLIQYVLVGLNQWRKNS